MEPNDVLPATRAPVHPHSEREVVRRLPGEHLLRRRLSPPYRYVFAWTEKKLTGISGKRFLNTGRYFGRFALGCIEDDLCQYDLLVLTESQFFSHRRTPDSASKAKPLVPASKMGAGARPSTAVHVFARVKVSGFFPFFGSFPDCISTRVASGRRFRRRFRRQEEEEEEEDDDHKI